MREAFFNFRSLSRIEPVPWNSKTAAAFLSLVCIWGALFALTWAHWGSLTVDCGREMYVPAELASGRTLYADLWYPYTPGAPYLNSFLFRVFGVHLNTLYWAGALAALGSACFLFLTGLQFGYLAAAWTAGAVLLMQSFGGNIHSFPLPYSFGTVYGFFSVCICLWLMMRAVPSSNPGWMLAAGLAAAVALLMKQEMGGPCFAALALLVAMRGIREQSFRVIARDLLALLPGAALSAAVIVWMFALRGTEFLTQENLLTWPTAYFMKRYGEVWLALTGLSLDRAVAMKSLFSLLVSAVLWLALRWILVRFGGRQWLFWAGFLGLAAVVALALYPSNGSESVGVARLSHWLVLPPAAPFYVAILTLPAVWLWWRSRFDFGAARVVVLFFLSAGVGARILLRMVPIYYPIFYDGAVVLCIMLVIAWLVDVRMAHQTRTEVRNTRATALLPYIATLAVVAIVAFPMYRKALDEVPLATARGVIYTSPQQAAAYRSLLDFIADHRRADESFLSVPEDVSIYFLAGIQCPLRVYLFTPGVVAPGKMTEETLQEIRQKQVRYVIWSNRMFPEYGTAEFGVDFNQPIGQYLKSAYRPLQTIGEDGGTDTWSAVIWERKDADASAGSEAVSSAIARAADGKF